jgi:polyphenol oxidase
MADRSNSSTRFPISRRDIIRGLGGAFLTGAGFTVDGPAYASDRDSDYCKSTVETKPPFQEFETYLKNQGAHPRIRHRKSVFELSREEKLNLERAYDLLRKPDEQVKQQILSDDKVNRHRFNILSLEGQSYVHCWRCGQYGGFDTWTKERHHPWWYDVHHNWLFLPWHRAYLYFHERILAMLLEDDARRHPRDWSKARLKVLPGFALPYWDWDTMGRDRFPREVYEEGSLKHAERFRPGTTFPSVPPILLTKDRNFLSQRWYKDLINGPRISKMMNSEPNVFFGGPGRERVVNGQSVLLEQPSSASDYPHNLIHDFTGMKMQDVMLSPQDPIFFAHHCNIDRLWDLWSSGENPHRGPVRHPLRDEWEKAFFYLYSEKRVWVKIRISDVVPESGHQRALHVTYHHPPKEKRIWAFKKRPERVQAPPAFLPEGPLLEIVPPLKPIELKAAPERRSVPLRDTRAAQELPKIKKGSAPEWVLHIDDVQVPENGPIFFNVFFNLPGGPSEKDFESPNFIGQASGLEPPPTGRYNFAFDLLDDVGRLFVNAEELVITLVPPDLPVPAPGAGATINRIYIDRER